MPLDLEEQEQLDQLKAFWQKYRNLITGVLTAALFAYAGYSGYQWWRTSQAAAASQLYETMVTAINKGDKDQTLRAADDLQKQFSSTPYAAMSSLVAAKISSDEGYLALAKLRLIAQLIEQGSEKDFAEADATLKEKPISGFEALWSERRGDWYLAQKNTTDARKSYEAAWKQLNDAKEFPEEARRLLKVKLDAVGGVAQ